MDTLENQQVGALEQHCVSGRMGLYLDHWKIDIRREFQEKLAIHFPFDSRFIFDRACVTT